jgi:transposase
VVDSASIEVNRRAKRAILALAGSARETDRLDVGKLLSMLIRYHSGEKKVCSVVHVLSVEAEDKRHLHRELTTTIASKACWRCHHSEDNVPAVLRLRN